MLNFVEVFPYNFSSSTSLTAASSNLSLNLMKDNSKTTYSDYNNSHNQLEDDTELDLIGKNPKCSSHEVVVDHVPPTTSSGIGNSEGNDFNSVSGSKLINTIKKGEKKIKKAKCAFQTRSQVDIIDDGYRWRKYGQKAVKNSKFPRSYYRCTYQECNVKKQVQRLSKDEGVVVTTYEGTHSHPIEKSTDNFEHILTQMQIYSSC
ncbi:probable WRKY transcription factor 75 [Lactuca sativa]|uniref:WRKY domain-containing protein n=1 Tax=Lactuca sativa TaxID=4236 RepID=A0A9R1UQC3_LACSA|nr:probable WRKY transcription factor 75 [Lactuca sativa]KAJ0190976.1 hypothetical protein LSAT_V11C800447900 [Lactuca sativa]